MADWLTYFDDFECGTFTAGPTPALLRIPRLRFFDSNHKPLVGGSLYLLSEGATSLTQTKASWQDYGKTILNPNPIILDSAGYASPIFVDSLYQIRVYDIAGNIIYSDDSVGSTTLGLLQITQAQLQFFDANGNPLANGKLYTCVSGAGSLNWLKDTFTGEPGYVIDNASNFVLSQSGAFVIVFLSGTLITVNPNPIILDAEGMAPPTYALPTDYYKLVLFDENSVIILTQDQVGTF